MRGGVRRSDLQAGAVLAGDALVVEFPLAVDLFQDDGAHGVFAVEGQIDESLVGTGGGIGAIPKRGET
jgi:hypothetical protein